MEVALTSSTVSPATNVRRENGEDVTGTAVPAAVPAIDYADNHYQYVSTINIYNDLH
jgi:hypothetical protein